MVIPVFDELKSLVRKSGYSHSQICAGANVERKTIKRWMDEKTFCPRIDTMLRVAQFLDHHNIELTPRLKKMAVFYGPRQQRFGLARFRDWRLI